MHHLDSLFALSPLDGRYVSSVLPLRAYFSEFALMKYRSLVEIEFLLQLSKSHIIRTFSSKEKNLLHHMIDEFSVDDAKRIKQFESETHHDVKAVEYFLKERLENTSLADILPFVHFGLTGDDTNNLAYALMVRDAHEHVVYKKLHEMLSALRTLALMHEGDVMLAKTHGQPAVPTTFGKELAVFYARLRKIALFLRTFTFEGKCNGAVGNYNALVFAYPSVDWISFSRRFISSLGLVPSLTTTQILAYDSLVEYMTALSRFNTICVGLCQDMWIYISSGLVKQKKESGHVGSSTMPHKVNPIHFENAEGNLQIANAAIELYARKLLVSRLQRDLSDSTVKRTFGATLGHTVLAWKSLEKGLGGISFDADTARRELNAHWEILSEAVQLHMRKHGDAKGYEKMKAATRGKTLNEKTFRQLVRSFPPLAKLTPLTYSGLAKTLARLALKS